MRIRIENGTWHLETKSWEADAVRGLGARWTPGARAWLTDSPAVAVSVMESAKERGFPVVPSKEAAEKMLAFCQTSGRDLREDVAAILSSPQEKSANINEANFFRNMRNAAVDQQLKEEAYAELQERLDRIVSGAVKREEPEGRDPRLTPLVGIRGRAMSRDDMGLVMAAVKEVAARCDGARAEDRRGFSSVDARIGRAFAEMNGLTNIQSAVALDLVHKYRDQLAPDVSAKLDEAHTRLHAVSDAAKAKEITDGLWTPWKPIAPKSPSAPSPAAPPPDAKAVVAPRPVPPPSFAARRPPAHLMVMPKSVSSLTFVQVLGLASKLKGAEKVPDGMSYTPPKSLADPVAAWTRHREEASGSVYRIEVDVTAATPTFKLYSAVAADLGDGKPVKDERERMRGAELGEYPSLAAADAAAIDYLATIDRERVAARYPDWSPRQVRAELEDILPPEMLPAALKREMAPPDIAARREPVAPEFDGFDI
jgi:hypothetical protein